MAEEKNLALRDEDLETIAKMAAETVFSRVTTMIDDRLSEIAGKVEQRTAGVNQRLQQLDELIDTMTKRAGAESNEAAKYEGRISSLEKEREAIGSLSEGMNTAMTKLSELEDRLNKAEETAGRALHETQSNAMASALSNSRGQGS